MSLIKGSAIMPTPQIVPQFDILPQQRCSFDPVIHPQFAPVLVEMKRDEYSELFVIERMTLTQALRNLPMKAHPKLNYFAFLEEMPNAETVLFFLTALDGTLEALHLGALLFCDDGAQMMCSHTYKFDDSPLTGLRHVGPMITSLLILFMKQSNLLPTNGTVLLDIKPPVLSYLRDFFSLPHAEDPAYDWSINRQEADQILAYSAFEFTLFYED